jgi:internalin A
MNNFELLKKIKSAIDHSSLDLSNNQLTFLPPEIGQLRNLSSLDLSNNQLTFLPPEIGQLRNLSSLDLSNNQLTFLPPEIGQLCNLNSLNILKNRLNSLPKEITLLKELTKLYLRFNSLTSLPSEIYKFENLLTLDVAFNQLSDVLPIYKITGLENFYYEGNQLPSIPLEIKTREWRSVLNFYQQKVEQKNSHLYEAKLIIIGEAGAGKTSLAKSIHNPEYELQNDEPSTNGIKVIQHVFLLENGKDFQVNIWDFGGQEIQHQTHQFFLTKRSLYILVADIRKEDTDFHYWLNVVELLSENSPLMIVKNEKQNIKLEINERQLRGEFTNLKEILATNLSTKNGLSEILVKLKHYISNLEHIGTELPETWIKAREVLEKDSRDYIGLEEFLSICQENGFTRQQDKLQFSEYLHDLGVCLHFQNDNLLRKTIILKPVWGTDAVYKVLLNPQVNDNCGRFNINELQTIWCEDKYSDMHPELLKLMMNFKLCYEIPNSLGNYIAPQLLSSQQPEYEWDRNPNAKKDKNILSEIISNMKQDNLIQKHDYRDLHLHYEYEFMPKGILTKFIVETHQLIENQSCVWKTGVVLNRNETRAEVVEKYRYYKGEINIRISGKRKRDFMTTIRDEFDKIHNSYDRLKYKTKVPCNCKECKDSQNSYFYELETLHSFLDKNKLFIQCYVSGERVYVQSLIDDISSEMINKVDSKKWRDKQKYTRLLKEWDSRHEKITSIRKSLVTETNPANIFQLEQQRKEEEVKIGELERILSEFD